MKFDGYLLVSDMDNTLLNSSIKASDTNLDAIRYFIANGGKFTVATGRTVHAAREHLANVPINAPAILHNGAKIYDFKTGETLFEKHIAEDRKSAVKIMHERYPFLGFEIYSDETAYVYSECAETARLKTRGYPTVFYMPDEIWDKPWTKLLMIGEKEVLDRYEPIYRSLDGGYAVRSGDKFFDVVADGVSKGLALSFLENKLKIKHNHVIAAGDNMNDIEMLNAAGISYAVENAEDAAKAAADFIAPSCDDDAIAWIINEIEKSINKQNTSPLRSVKNGAYFFDVFNKY